MSPKTLSRVPTMLVVGLLVQPLLLSAQGREGDAAARALVTRLWSAEADEGRAAAVEAIDESDVEFEALWLAFREGREYSSAVPRGTIVGVRNAADGTAFPYFVQIPDGYSPQKRYPVRVFLHGGVSRGAWNPRSPEWWRSPQRVASEEYIGIFPASWGEQRWWQTSQLENLRGVLRVVRATYNIDENRVALIGVSDGGTGAYFVAFKDTTPWASFLPFISHPAVLQNPRVGATGETFRTNLTNKPLFIVNGDQDRLYPTASVDPFIADFSSAGVEMIYLPLEGVGHEVGWWSDEASKIDAFIEARPREAHPTCISWETESSTRGERAHWITIDELGPTPLDARFEASALMDPDVASGRVDAHRVGNEIRLSSSGVSRLSLLVSPDAFDFGTPVTVWWNGRLVHDAAVESSVEVLTRWAARDDDRTMLYAAELALEAPESGAPDPAKLPSAPGSSECRGV